MMYMAIQENSVNIIYSERLMIMNCLHFRIFDITNICIVTLNVYMETDQSVLGNNYQRYLINMCYAFRFRIL